jgi:hypothetical protein
MTAIATATVHTTTSTRTLLTFGAVAGPLWVAVSLAQAATRDGFDLTRHPLSALSTGELGWLQITNFLVAGAFAIAGAAGLRRALRGSPGGRWAPRLIGISGAGMMAAGVLVMDRADGFPAGTPAGVPTTMSWHSVGHMVAGSVTFTALIAACYVLARHYSAAGNRRRAGVAILAGTALLVGDGWAACGGPAGALVLAVGAISALLFVASTAAHYRR